MITVKRPEDFEKMAVAGRTVAAVHEAIREEARPGVTLNRLDEIAADIIRSRGCTPSFLGYMGYPKTICLSPNNVIVHGIPDGTVVRDGDVLSVDVGAIFEGWHGDAAFSMAIGDVPDEVSQLIDLTEKAMWAGVAQAAAGNRLGDVGHAVAAVAEPHGYGVVREYIGHGIGQQMHEKPEVPNYGEPGRGLKLKKGWAICVEPMFNLGGAATKVLEDGWSVVTADGSLSAHWEHTVAITDDGPMVLTLPEPRLVTASV